MSRRSTAPPSSRRWRAPQGVVAQAARDLGLSRQALYRRMEKLGIKTDVTDAALVADGGACSSLAMLGCDRCRRARGRGRAHWLRSAAAGSLAGGCWSSPCRSSWWLREARDRTLVAGRALPCSDGVVEPARPRFQRQHHAGPHDELGELVAGLQLARRPAAPRAPDLYQRELLLDTVMQTTPLAMVLTNAARPHRLQQHRRAAAVARRPQARGAGLPGAARSSARAAARGARARRRRAVHRGDRRRAGGLPPLAARASCSTPSRTSCCCSSSSRASWRRRKWPSGRRSSASSPRAQQLAGADLARSRTRAACWRARPRAARARARVHDHRRARRAPRPLHRRLRAVRQAAAARGSRPWSGRILLARLAGRNALPDRGPAAASAQASFDAASSSRR